MRKYDRNPPPNYASLESNTSNYKHIQFVFNVIFFRVLKIKCDE